MVSLPEGDIMGRDTGNTWKRLKATCAFSEPETKGAGKWSVTDLSG